MGTGGRAVFGNPSFLFGPSGVIFRAFPPVTDPGAAPPPTPKRRPRTRRRFWLLLLVTLLAAALLHPPAWHGALRAFIAFQASQRGWSVQLGPIDGGLFDATVVHDVRCRKVFPAPAAGEEAGGVDLRIARAEAVLDWRWPFGQDAARGFLERVTLDGVSGTMDFTSADATGPAASRARGPAPRPAGLTPGFVLKWWPLVTAAPANFELVRVNCRVRRGGVWLRVEGARLTAYRDSPGQCLARQVGLAGPGFENTLADRSASTAWRDGQLTLAHLNLGRGLDLVRATIDGGRLRKRQLDWDSELHALGGSVRSQGTVRFAHGRIGLDIAGSFQQVAVRPLARLLGVEGATDGTIDQGQFSFRGNPERWTEATISLAGQTTDFRWQKRRWESLDLAAIVLHQRVTVRKLELRQSRNQLSVSGECPLPSSGPDGRWKLDGFTCQLDAKLDDLQSLAQLFAPGWLPPITGRMSVNGSLTARPQGDALDGYLNVEGSALSVAGAPLDYVRSTLLFQGEELQIADVQATRATDYLSGKGSVRVFGAPRYQGELHAAVADLAVYHPAYAGALSSEPLGGMLRLNWTGDGAPGAHSGTFRGSVADFSAKSGPAHFSRPVTLEADGTYSPESVSFRRLALKEGIGDKRHDAIKLEGALPFEPNPTAAAFGNAAYRASRTKPLALRITLAEAPLDLLAEGLAEPGLSATGQASGWLDVSGLSTAPRLEGNLQLRHAGLRRGDDPPVDDATADLRLEDNLLRLDEARGQRGGARWQASGSIDLHRLEAPLFDLSLTSDRVPRAIDTALVQADAEMLLLVRGPAGSGEISGAVRLLNGTVRRCLELGSAGEEAGDWDVAAGTLPAGWAGERLALQVTAGKPLRGVAGAEFGLDLVVGGLGKAPVLHGRIELRKGALGLAQGGGWAVESGAIYLSPGETPTVDLRAEKGRFGFGPVDGVRVVTAPEWAGDLGKLWEDAERLSPEAMWAPDGTGWPLRAAGVGDRPGDGWSLRWR